MRDKLRYSEVIAPAACSPGVTAVGIVAVQRGTSEIPAPSNGGGSRIRQRQRRRLIDACISALHIYGPSRTTVGRVVALADLSPGIVRFYFDSKASMLVASLDYLAREFEDSLSAFHLTIGRGVLAGDHLWKHPDVGGITFTGSYPVGMDIYKHFTTEIPKPVI